MEFAAVVVTFNNAGEIGGLLGDLRALAPRCRVVVVDNASRDGTADEVRRFGGVRLIRNRRNVGFARAANQAVAEVDAEHVFVLNPDLRIPERAFFERLAACLATDPRVAAAGPLQLQERSGRRRLNFTWSYWSRRGLALFAAHRLGIGRRPHQPFRTLFLNCGCLLVRRSAWARIGGLDERYFLYGEEPDLAFKLLRHGYECRLHPGVAVLHRRESSLRSLARRRRLALKARAAVNIADALARGCWRLLGDRLRGAPRRPSAASEAQASRSESR